MADEYIEFEERGADDVARAYKKVGDAAEQAGKDIEESGDKSEQAGGRIDGLTRSMAKYVATAAVVKEAVVDGVREFARQGAAVGRLQRSYRKAGGTAREYAQTIKILDKRSDDLGVSFTGQLDLLSQLIDQTGNVRVAQEDLALAVDIAAAENMELERSVEALRKARNGEVEELKNLDGINKDLAESLNKIEDASTRGEEAIRHLKEEYKGAAEETRGLENDLDQLKNTIDEKLLPSVGKLVTKIAGSGEDGGLVGAIAGLVGGDKERGLIQRWSDQLDSIGTDIDNLVERPSFETLTKALFAFQRGGARFIGLLDEEEGAAPRGGGLEGAPDIRPGAVMGMQEVPEPASPSTGKKKRKRRARGKQEKDSGLREAALGAGEGFLEQQEAARQAEQQRKDLQALFEHRQKLREQETQQFKEQLAERQMAFKRKLANDQRLAEQAAQARMDIQRQETLQQISGISETVTAATDGLASLAKNEKAALALQIGGAAARAALTWAYVATPPPVGGPQYLPGAIAQTTAVARMIAEAGGGGGAAPKRPTGASAAGASARGRGQGGSPQETTLIGEGSRASRGGGAGPSPLVVNVNSAFPPSPEQAAQLAKAVERDRRRMT